MTLNQKPALQFHYNTKPSFDHNYQNGTKNRPRKFITINNTWSRFGENMNMNVYWNTGQGTCHHLVTLIMGERLSNKRTQKGQTGNVSCDILYAFDA